PRLLRPGLVSPSEIEAVIGKIAIGPASRCEQIPLDAESEEAAKAVVRSPGMLARHYAPSVPLECVPAEELSRLETLRREHRRIGWLSFGPAPSGSCGLSIIEMPTQPEGYAAHLYAALHSLESAGVERIIVSLPPDAEPWLAVRDRLQRASAPA
ncbi:MAG TPA: Sua5 family C-terminal domain-containing protein, partial [Pirellulales bacterium]|nr:Sua5 family C-terminal domain-containing protein [Pirellulales bacterium]